jgi:hypothetical protein
MVGLSCRGRHVTPPVYEVNPWPSFWLRAQPFQRVPMPLGNAPTFAYPLGPMADPADGKRQVAKKPSLLGNILKNTQDTSAKYEATKAQSQTLLCKTCGAARPDDAALEVCAYCGNTFL